ncbi:MAG TPA: hypothetical protein PLL66_01130 [Bacteroidales bacterium]|nr:hypothetical protein [Bacteroidales bacterium]
MKKKRILLIISISLAISAFAQESSSKFEVGGYLKYMQTTSFSDISEYWITDNLIHNRLDLSYYPTEWLELKLSFRNRFFFGQQVSLMYYPGIGNLYAKMIDKNSAFIDLSWNYLENKSFFFNTSIDRAFVDIQKGKWNITAGRHRINWGQTFVWNSNDIFNAYSYFDFDYEEKPGSDAIRIQYNLDYASRIDLAASLNNDTSITAAGLFVFNKFNYDFQFIGGVFRSEDYVAGFGFTGNLFNGSFRGEASYFHNITNFPDTIGTISASVGYDYVFKNSLMVQCEFLFNTSAPKESVFSLTDLYAMQLSAKNLWFSRFAMFTAISYPVSPIINISLSGMYSPQNNFIFAGPSVSFSMSDNFMIDFNLQTFHSNIPLVDGGKGTYAFLRGRWSF